MSTLNCKIYLADNDRDFFEEILNEINGNIKFKASKNGVS